MIGMIALNHKKRLNSMILIACIISFAFVSFIHDTAQASVKHALLGALVGAGAVIAWPTITAAATSLAGGAIAVGTAAAGAIATGGAVVGGAVAGAGAAVGGAVTAGFGAIGGAVAAITASPLFLPALAIVAVAAVGYFAYKHFKKQRIVEDASAKKDEISTPTTGRISDKNSSVNEEQAKPATNTNIVADKNTTPDKNTTTTTTIDSTKPYQDNSANAIKDRYSAAYKNYINLLQTDTTDRKSVV